MVQRMHRPQQRDPVLEPVEHIFRQIGHYDKQHHGQPPGQPRAVDQRRTVPSLDEPVQAERGQQVDPPSNQIDLPIGARCAR